ncbi:MAG: UbiA-like polyprenyltransferase [Candidatus Dormibacteria bacterium]
MSAAVAPRHPVQVLLHLVQFEHTIFALPFAYTGMVLAAASWSWRRFIGITVAMVAARTAAFAFNRLFDRRIDALNPRTAMRPLPAGEIGAKAVWALGAGSVLVLAVTAYLLNPVCLLLLPIPAALFLGYPLVKRFSPLAHFVLGLAIAGAPVGAWLATTGDAPRPALWLGLAVATWMAGMDIIYALQDVTVDREQHLHSLPADLSPAAALMVSSALHILTIAFLVMMAASLNLNYPFYLAILAAAGFLTYEHRLVRPGDISRVNRAFFTVNSYFAVIVLAGALAARTWG